ARNGDPVSARGISAKDGVAPATHVDHILVDVVRKKGREEDARRIERGRGADCRPGAGIEPENTEEFAVLFEIGVRFIESGVDRARAGGTDTESNIRAVRDRVGGQTVGDTTPGSPAVRGAENADAWDGRVVDRVVARIGGEFADTGVRQPRSSVTRETLPRPA